MFFVRADKHLWLSYRVYEDIINKDWFVIPYTLYQEKYKELPHQTYLRLISKGNSEEYSLKSVKLLLLPFIEKSINSERLYKNKKYELEIENCYQLSLFDNSN